MYKYRRYVIPMTRKDEVIVDMGFARPGQLTRASVHYRAQIGDEWHEVVRYDNAHGRAHRHQFWMEPPVRPLADATTPTALIERAKADLRDNWLRYRHLLEATL